jgi:hypothetical protein
MNDRSPMSALMRGRCVSASAMAVACLAVPFLTVACGASRAQGPPAQGRPVQGPGPGPPSAPLPGVAFPVDLSNYVPGHRPSLRQCLDAWNNGGPPNRTRRWIGGHASGAALVQVGQLHKQPIGTTQIIGPTVSWICEYEFAVGKSRIAYLTGPWSPRLPSRWQGQVTTYATSVARKLEAPFKSHVSQQAALSMP